MCHTWFLLGLVECSHNGVNRRQQTNTVKNNNLPLERESRSFAEISTQNVEQMQWWWLEGLLSGWRGRLGRTVVAPCPPEFSCTDQGWRVNPEDVSPTHQSNITPVEPTGKAKSFSTFLFLIFMWGLFTRWLWKPEEHLNLTSETWPKEVKDEVLGRPRKWGETSWTDWSTTPKVVNFPAISLNFENTLKNLFGPQKNIC